MTLACDDASVTSWTMRHIVRYVGLDQMQNIKFSVDNEAITIAPPHAAANGIWYHLYEDAGPYKLSSLQFIDVGDKKTARPNESHCPCIGLGYIT